MIFNDNFLFFYYLQNVFLLLRHIFGRVNMTEYLTYFILYAG